MLSAGNDIVSLAEIDVTRTNTKQFYSKILSGNEVSHYHEAIAPAIPFVKYVWLLWSAKEAAYKFLKRVNPGLVFTPVKFEVKQLNIPAGYATDSSAMPEITGSGFNGNVTSVVEADIFSIGIVSMVCNEFIASFANAGQNFDNVFWGIKTIGTSDRIIQSAEVRAFLLENLTGILKSNDLHIGKNLHDVPVLLQDSEELPVPVSLAHHGHYVSYSFCIGAITAV